MMTMEEKLSDWIEKKRKEQFSKKSRKRTQREYDADWKKFINSEVLGVMRIRSLPSHPDAFTRLAWLIGNIRIIAHPKVLSIYIKNLRYRRGIKKRAKPFQ